jgi:hypothetical protein
MVQIFKPVRNAIKKVASNIPIDSYERLMAYSILKNEFKEISNIPTFPSREELWRHCIAKCVGSYSKITYIEFGVYRGYSIKCFAKLNTNENSVFIGLDSFEGLPENWGGLEKGIFSTDDLTPETADNRVSFIKGRFQNTWSQLYSQLGSSKIDNLVVHYDADLYSSTLFALSKIESLQESYFAIFDEFTGHETRALYNYCQAYSAKVSFLGKTAKTDFKSRPEVLLCRITPSFVANCIL